MDDLENSRALKDLLSAYEYILGDGDRHDEFKDLCSSSGYDPDEFASRAHYILNMDCVDYDLAKTVERRLMWLSVSRKLEAVKASES